MRDFWAAVDDVLLVLWRVWVPARTVWLGAQIRYTLCCTVVELTRKKALESLRLDFRHLRRFMSPVPPRLGLALVFKHMRDSMNDPQLIVLTTRTKCVLCPGTFSNSIQLSANGELVRIPGLQVRSAPKGDPPVLTPVTGALFVPQVQRERDRVGPSR
jgi:hypothetical protein